MIVEDESIISMDTRAKLTKMDCEVVALVQSTNEGICELDKNFNIRFINTKGAEMLGYAEDELIGKPLLSLIHPDEMASQKKIFNNRMSGNTDTYERTFVKKDKSSVNLLISAVPVFLLMGYSQGHFP